MTDQELEACIREQLYLGCVDQALEFLHDIEDPDLAQALSREIREYEQFCGGY